MSDRSHWVRNANSLFPLRNISVSPKWANRSHRVCIANFMFPFCNTLVSPKWANPSHRVCLTNPLCTYCWNRSHWVYAIGQTEITLFPNPGMSVPSRWLLVPPKILTFTFLPKSVWPSLLIWSHQVWESVDPSCILFISDSEHKANAMFCSTYEINPSSEHLLKTIFELKI